MKVRLQLIKTVAIAWLLPAAVHASEESFYRGTQWEVVLVNSHSATQEVPYCAIRTTSWSSRFVAIEMPLLNLDRIGLSVRVQKSGWALPVGQSTAIGVISAPIGAELVAKAVSDDALYAPMDENAATATSGMLSLVIGRVFNENKPMGFLVGFKGNEQPWVVPATDRLQAAQVLSANRACNSALTALGPSIFSTGGNSEGTSPFGDAKGNPAMQNDTANNDPADESMGLHEGEGVEGAAENWKFTLHEEDWGSVCVVETKKDDVNIGLLASPGKNLLAFVDGLDLKSAQSIWRVDSLKAHAVEGEFDSDYNWLGFTFPTARLIAELAEGSVLNLSVIGKARYAIEVSSAREAFSQFAACYAKNGVADEDIAE